MKHPKKAAFALALLLLSSGAQARVGELDCLGMPALIGDAHNTAGACALTVDHLLGITINSVPASGNLVGTTDTETLTNKAIDASSNTLSHIPNSALTNNTISIAGNVPALGSSVTQDQITGLSSLGLVKRTGTNALGIATAGTDYLSPGVAATLSAVLTIPSSDLAIKGSSTGTTAIASANASATNYTVTYPAATDTVDLIATAQTLSNKSISGSANILTNIPNSALTNNTISIAGNVPALGGSVTLDQITGLSTLGLVQRTGANAFGIAGVSGTGNVCYSTNCVMTTPNLGTPSAVNLANGTGLPLSTGVTGVLPSANGGAGSIIGLLKANGSGVTSQAVAGTDYVSPSVAETFSAIQTFGTDIKVNNIVPAGSQITFKQGTTSWLQIDGGGVQMPIYGSSTNAYVCFAGGYFMTNCPSGTTASIGGSALAAGACASATASITGATTSMVAVASPVTYPGDGFSMMTYVSASGVVTVKVCAIVAGTPAASTYRIRLLQ